MIVAELLVECDALLKDGQIEIVLRLDPIGKLFQNNFIHIQFISPLVPRRSLKTTVPKVGQCVADDKLGEVFLQLS